LKDGFAQWRGSVASGSACAIVCAGRPSVGDYIATITPASGSIKATRTRLAMVELGGLIVRDVEAMVLPDDALSENLLGLSFLSKLKRSNTPTARWCWSSEAPWLPIRRDALMTSAFKAWHFRKISIVELPPRTAHGLKYRTRFFQ
jgi:gag-polyprotein putative aspartyl protease